MKYLELIKIFFTFAKIIFEKMGTEKGDVRIKGPVQVIGKDGWPVSLIVSKCDDVSKSDSTILPPGVLYIGTGGSVVVRPVGGKNIVTFTNVPDGTFLPVLVDKVMNATTATGIIICY